MSEAQNAAQEVTQGVAQEVGGEVSQPAAGSVGTGEGQVQKTYMFFFHPELQQWMLHPYYANIFQQQYYILEVVQQYINKKWTEEQTAAYLSFVQNFRMYVSQYALGNQVFFFEDYNAAVQYYVTSNPVGAQLYEKQREYVQKLLNGYDFKNDKKNKNKDPNGPKQQQPKPKPKEQQKQRVVIRSGDPQINLQKLFGTQWDPTKYLSSSFLAKQNINIVFIGHVDSGKSTLTGNIMTQLKEVDEQELARTKQDSQQNKMESWEKAGISDIIPEERADGKTREFAKMNFQLPNKRFTLFDAPGHKNYVPNMIMGACQADVAVLIISAKEGEFQSGFEKDGQTKEHAMLAKALGVVELIAVVTKMGTVDWSEKRYQLIKEQVTPFLDNNCGFHKVAFIPIDSLINTNIHTRIENSWYNGPCLTEYLDTLALPQRKPMGPLRMPVIDKFKDVGNMYVYGKIESGTIIEDQTVTLLPSRMQMVIREIYNAKDERMGFACAGENVKVRIKNVEEHEINRGDMICNNLNYCQESAEFKANLTILELPDQKKLVSSGYECVMHMHAIAVEIMISKIESRVDKETGKKVAIGFLKTGEKGVCQIKVERPICLEKYEFMHSLGRFVLRDEGKTIGYGEIVGIKPAKTLLKEQKDQLIGEVKEGTSQGLAKSAEGANLPETGQ